MNDETLIRLLGGLNKPADPNPAFAERLFGVVRVEAARPRRVQVRHLLAAAALLVLTLTAVTAYVLATRPHDERAVVVPPPVPSVKPSIHASALPVDSTVVDGLIAVQRMFPGGEDTYDQRIRFIDPKTGEDAFVTPSTTPSCGAQFSPDGSRYAFLMVDMAEVTPADHFPLYVGVASATSEFQPTKLLRNPAQNWFHPSWAPDGSAFVATIEADEERTAPRELWVFPDDGTSPRRLTDAPASYSADWSASGDWIAFVGGGQKLALEIIRPDGTDMRVLQPDGVDSVAWSPVRDELAYSSNDGHLHVITIDGYERLSAPDGRGPQDFTQVWTGTLPPTWSDDGTKIALTPEGVLKVFDVDSGSVTTVPTPAGGWPTFRGVARVAWSASGQSLAVVSSSLVNEGNTDTADLWEVPIDGTTPRLIATEVRGNCMSAGNGLSWQRVTK